MLKSPSSSWSLLVLPPLPVVPAAPPAAVPAACAASRSPALPRLRMDRDDDIGEPAELRLPVDDATDAAPEITDAEEEEEPLPVVAASRLPAAVARACPAADAVAAEP